MKIEISLSQEQAVAVRAISKFARLSVEDVVLGCATALWNQVWDDAAAFRDELRRNATMAREGRPGKVDASRRLGCGVRLPATKIGPIERLLTSYYREALHWGVAPDDAARSVRFDPATNIIRFGHGWPNYRWTGKKVVRLAA